MLGNSVHILSQIIYTRALNLYSMGKGAMPIQGDSGGKANILGGDNTGHCDKKVHTNIV